MRSTRSRWLSLIVATSLVTLASCVDPEDRVDAHVASYGPGVEVSVSHFRDALDPYGRWIDYEPYGWVWAPDGVYSGWRPYSDGYWTYSEYGWTWVSYEPWGWGPYHYGRWMFDHDYGWVWVPGSVWAPAWVSWRYSDDWIGWAPLPPAAGWSLTAGLNLHRVESIPLDSWCFVEPRHLKARHLRGHIEPFRRNRTLLAGTRDATRFAVFDGHPVNRGLDIGRLEREHGIKIPRENARDVDGVAGNRRMPGVLRALGLDDQDRPRRDGDARRVERAREERRDRNERLERESQDRRERGAQLERERQDRRERDARLERGRKDRGDRDARLERGRKDRGDRVARVERGPAPARERVAREERGRDRDAPADQGREPKGRGAAKKDR